jgi:hypothetical protein
LTSSAFGAAEWLEAYRQDPTGLAGRVIPIRIENCTVDGILAGIVYADLVGFREKTAARSALLEAVRGAVTRRCKPLVEPDFPGASLATQRVNDTPVVPACAGGWKPLWFEETRAANGVMGLRRRGAEHLAQVQKIAPKQLFGRDAELAAMAAFCTGVGAGTYVWWRAEAWTGKTALMSTFVLHPPPGALVVSFFISARYAQDSDRAAFVEVVNEQLAIALGQTPPRGLTPAAQERSYWSLLAQAAEHCREDGQRLVLVVDGLDQDCGAATGPHAGSIAALLPGNPPAGMRVIVAGRADPPPADVPSRHPLRDDDAAWLLRLSKQHAAVVQGHESPAWLC